MGWAFTEKSFNEFDQSLLNRLEGRCIEPKNLYSFPDLFLTADHRLACSVLSVFNPDRFMVSALNFQSARLITEEIALDPITENAVARYVADQDRDTLISKGFGAALLGLVEDPERKTQLNQSDLNQIAGPNFYTLFIDPYFQKPTSGRLTRADVVTYAKILVDSAGLMSRAFLVKAVETYRQLLIQYLFLGNGAESYRTVIDFAMTMSEDELRDYLAIEYFFPVIDDDVLDSIAPILKIRSFANSELSGFSRQEQSGLYRIIRDTNIWDVEIIYLLEDLRRCIDLHYSDNCLYSWSKIEKELKESPADLRHYLSYFPSVRDSGILQLSYKHAQVRILQAFNSDSIDTLSPVERRVSLGLVSEYFLAYANYEESREKYPDIPAFWVMPVKANAIAYWSTHISPIVKLNVKHFSELRRNDVPGQDYTDEAIKILKSNPRLCSPQFSWLDCAHLIRVVDLISIDDTSITVAIENFIDGETGLEKEISFEAGATVGACTYDPIFENFFREKVLYGNIDSFFTKVCFLQDLLDATGIPSEGLPAFFLRSIAFHNGRSFTENGLISMYGLGLVSASVRHFAKDSRRLSAPVNYQNLIESSHHGIYQKSFSDSKLTKFEHDETDFGPNYLAASYFYESIGAYEKALVSITKAIDQAIYEESGTLPWDLWLMRISLQRILMSLGLSSEYCRSIDKGIPWNLAQLTPQEILDQLQLFFGGQEGFKLFNDSFDPIKTWFNKALPNEFESKGFSDLTARDKSKLIAHSLAYLASLTKDERGIALETQFDWLARDALSDLTFSNNIQVAQSSYGVGSTLINPVIADLRQEQVTDYLSSPLFEIDFDSNNSLLKSNALAFSKFLADQGGRHRSSVAVVLSTYMLSEQMTSASAVFVSKNSTQLRRIQTEFEDTMVTLFESIREIKEDSIRNHLSQQFLLLENGFHVVLASNKHRNRLLHPLNNPAENAALSQSISANIKEVANSRNLRSYFSAIGEAGDLIYKVPVDLNATAKTLLAQRKKLADSDLNELRNVFYSDGNLLVTGLSSGDSFAISAKIDDSVVKQAKVEITEIGRLSKSTINKLCDTFKTTAKRLGIGIASERDLFVIPSVNLLPIPHEFIFGNVCSSKDIPAVIYASSTGAYLDYIQRDLIPIKSLVAIGNPLLEESPTVADSRMIKLLEVDSFPSLPEAEREAIEIAGKFSDSRSLIKREASIVEGLRFLEKTDEQVGRKALLLATHGISAKPDLGIFFPSLLSVENGEMALVSSADIYGFELNDAIVSLSACETGSGITDEEGMYFSGLPTSFADAGASFIVASLWPIPDEDSRIISTAFFEGLSDGLSEQLAVAKAQSSLGNTQRLPFAFILP